MKIGFDAKRLYKNFTGLGNYSRVLLHNLHLLHPKQPLYLYTTQIEKNESTKPFLNNKSFVTFTPTTPFKNLWRSSLIRKKLYKDNIDIFHGLSQEIPFRKQKSHIKDIVTIHDLIFKIYPKTYTLFDREIYNFKAKYACCNANKIVAISQSTKNDIVKYYKIQPEKIHVIYQACNPLFYTLQHNIYTKKITKQYDLPSEYLLYVGSIVARKNLITLLKSLILLPETLRIPLVIIGNGNKYKQFIISFIKKNNLNKYIIWLSHLQDNTHLQAIYQKAQMLIYPSLYEGFGLPIVEALLSKTPVITSNISSLPEAGGPSSLYLNNPVDPEEMSQSIINVLENSVLREKMRYDGFSYAHEKFNAYNTATQLWDLYNKTSTKK